VILAVARGCTKPRVLFTAEDAGNAGEGNDTHDPAIHFFTPYLLHLLHLLREQVHHFALCASAVILAVARGCTKPRVLFTAEGAGNAG
jgi:hypothetical protein